MKQLQNGQRRRATLLTTIVSGAAMLIGAGMMFKFLRAVLQEHFVTFLWGLLGIVLVVNIVFLILWRSRPDLVAQFREPLQPAAQTLRRPYGSTARIIFTVVGVLCTAIAVAGGWFMWSAPDFGYFALLWVLPSIYLAVTALYIGITGKE